jgi:hypothetical protein
MFSRWRRSSSSNEARMSATRKSERVATTGAAAVDAYIDELLANPVSTHQATGSGSPTTGPEAVNAHIDAMLANMSARHRSR